MTRPNRAHAPFGLVVVAASVLTGCTGQDNDGRLSPDLSSQSSTTSASAEQLSKDAARGKVYEWVSGRGTVLSSPETYLDTSSIGFAEGTAATSIIAEAGELRLKNRKQSGAAKLTVDPEVTELNLDPPKKKGATVAPYATVRACIDESKTHVIDASGAKIAGTEGKGPHPVSFHVLNRHYPDPVNWRIAWSKDLKGAC